MKALITGGAGFIGSNTAFKLSSLGWDVTIFDNLSRKGTLENIKQLEKVPGINIEIGDIREFSKLKKNVKVDAIIHLAAQTAVTSSITNPQEDFDINLIGTLNLLEAVRAVNRGAVLIYSSTNKVYGGLNYLEHSKNQDGYFIPTYPNGIPENVNLDLHSPYGVSKGSAESYIHDYSRIYGLNTVVFRQSCVYGRFQLGVEDQGWAAHMGASVLLGKPINIYGDGEQVRDLLYVDDLVELYLKAIENPIKSKGCVFNAGGGVTNSTSINGYVELLRGLTGMQVYTNSFNSRPGDQRYFVSDNTRAKEVLAWEPKTNYKNGTVIMLDWIKQNLSLFESFR